MEGAGPDKVGADEDEDEPQPLHAGAGFSLCSKIKGKRKRPERPERKEPGAEPREIESEMASPEGAEDWIGVFMIRKFANLLILEILSP